jgi:hypothetical protein
MPADDEQSPWPGLWSSLARPAGQSGPTREPERRRRPRPDGPDADAREIAHGTRRDTPE